MPSEIDFWDAGQLGEVLGQGDAQRAIELLERVLDGSPLKSFRDGLIRGRALVKQTDRKEPAHAGRD